MIFEMLFLQKEIQEVLFVEFNQAMALVRRDVKIFRWTAFVVSVQCVSLVSTS